MSRREGKHERREGWETASRGDGAPPAAAAPAGPAAGAQGAQHIACEQAALEVILQGRDSIVFFKNEKTKLVNSKKKGRVGAFSRLQLRRMVVRVRQLVVKLQNITIPRNN